MPGARSNLTWFGFQSPPVSGNSNPRSAISEVHGEGNEEEGEDGEEGFWAFSRAKTREADKVHHIWNWEKWKVRFSGMDGWDIWLFVGHCSGTCNVEAFLKRLILHTAQIPAKKPNFGGMQYQSTLKTLRHCEYRHFGWCYRSGVLA